MPELDDEEQSGNVEGEESDGAQSDSDEVVHSSAVVCACVCRGVVVSKSSNLFVDLNFVFISFFMSWERIQTGMTGMKVTMTTQHLMERLL
jgi:hypothetical protein